MDAPAQPPEMVTDEAQTVTDFDGTNHIIVTANRHADFGVSSSGETKCRRRETHQLFSMQSKYGLIAGVNQLIISIDPRKWIECIGIVRAD